jgi:hypothetical protein
LQQRCATTDSHGATLIMQEPVTAAAAIAYSAELGAPANGICPPGLSRHTPPPSVVVGVVVIHEKKIGTVALAGNTNPPPERVEPAPTLLRIRVGDVPTVLFAQAAAVKDVATLKDGAVDDVAPGANVPCVPQITAMPAPISAPVVVSQRGTITGARSRRI